MRPATVRVGLVSPRSTCESMGAETPVRSARSRRLRPMASRRAFTRGPTEARCGAATATFRTLSHTFVCQRPGTDVSCQELPAFESWAFSERPPALTTADAVEPDTFTLCTVAFEKSR